MCDRLCRFVHQIPMFFAVLAFNFFAAANAQVITALTAIYTACRVLHTVFFAYALQPWRSIVWIIAVRIPTAFPFFPLRLFLTLARCRVDAGPVYDRSGHQFHRLGV